jgi:hypothetical protein
MPMHPARKHSERHPPSVRGIHLHQAAVLERLDGEAGGETHRHQHDRTLLPEKHLLQYRHIISERGQWDLSSHNFPTFKPIRCNSSVTLFQLDPSVQAACTRTTLASVLALVMISYFLSYLRSVGLRDSQGKRGVSDCAPYEEPPLAIDRFMRWSLWRLRGDRGSLEWHLQFPGDESLTRSGPCRRNALPRYGCRV